MRVAAVPTLTSKTGAALTPQPCGDELQAEAQAAAEAIEARYTDEDLERLIRAKGIDVNLPDPFKPAAEAGKA